MPISHGLNTVNFYTSNLFYCIFFALNGFFYKK